MQKREYDENEGGEKYVSAKASKDLGCPKIVWKPRAGIWDSR